MSSTGTGTGAADTGDLPASTQHERPALMTVGEVAAQLRVSRATVYRLVNDGTLPGKRLGRAVRIPRRVIEDFLDEDTATSP